ncbi:Ca2+-dependent phosphoinositide-specific phospholipase C [Formosa haliotis]|uniref:Ca2+-dependent phosphoinositide-specific phospholipase C n=1 Tax=Formosa haliotis TaxID=1555194 RepID=UPI000A951376|nr:Ca2+-dependent phosphoinositide-specific phospholipase C [Formosa haliotis]
MLLTGSVFTVFPSVAQEVVTQTLTLENNKVEVQKTLKINQIQVLGTHNSYAKPVDPKVFELVNPIFEKVMSQYKTVISEEEQAKMKEFHPHQMPLSEMLAYNHPDFKAQLDAGLRSLELDVYYDPTGNRFNSPATYEILKQKGVSKLAPFDTIGLDKPGFKLMHMADIDFRTHYPTFEGGLKALKTWSDKNPTHTPIFIMVEAKDKGFSIFPNSAEVLPFTEQAFDELDALVLKTLGKEKLITPDDVRNNYSTLEAAVLAKNWPLLKDSLGKFVFMLLPSGGGLAAESAYVKNHPVLENRVMFVQSEPGQPFASFLLRDNAIVRQDSIQDEVAKGYLVRTRSDIETYEAKVNDNSRAEAAFSSGAQVISTDFFKPGNSYNTDYWVQLPNKKPMRENPINSKNN